jgi:hypothetical protein
MTTSLQSTISAQLGWTWRDHVGQSAIVDSNRLVFSKSLADGGGTAQCDAVWHAEARTLAAGQSTTLLLRGLEQTLFGDTITIALAQVKAIQIVNRSSEGGYLLVGGAEANAWYAPFGSPGDTVRVMPDSPLVLASARDGWNVGFGYDALRIAAVGDPVTYDVAVLGVLAGSGGSSSGG